MCIVQETRVGKCEPIDAIGICVEFVVTQLVFNEKWYEQESKYAQSQSQYLDWAQKQALLYVSDDKFQ